MSRVGKSPVVIPQGVELQVNGRDITVKGKLGTMTWSVHQDVEFSHKDNEVTFEPRNNTKAARALWGTSRATIANMVQGVSEGFSKKLTVHGVGYRAAIKGNLLDISAGFSHPVEMPIPEGLKVEVTDNTNISITGFDKQKLGQFAADVRAVRPPEPYKGKGIRYADERVRMKEGKKKK